MTQRDADRLLGEVVSAAAERSLDVGRVRAFRDRFGPVDVMLFTGDGYVCANRSASGAVDVTVWGYPHTARAAPLIVVLATDDRVPAPHRMQLVEFLFSMATLADKHVAESWPHADPVSEAAARQAVAEHLNYLLGRWDVECTAVRLHLAALAVTFPTPRTRAALEARLAGLRDRFPQGTHTGDLVRFTLTMATMNDSVILDAVEGFTDTYWRGTYRGVPVAPRAMHLLHQMLEMVRTSAPNKL